MLLLGKAARQAAQYIHWLGARLHLTLPHSLVALPACSSVALRRINSTRTGGHGARQPPVLRQGGLRWSPYRACLSSREAALRGRASDSLAAQDALVGDVCGSDGPGPKTLSACHAAAGVDRA
jgi:hypothetical protein